MYLKITFNDESESIEASQIHQLQRTEGMTTSQLERSVDILCSRVSC